MLLILKAKSILHLTAVCSSRSELVETVVIFMLQVYIQKLYLLDLP